MSLVIFHEARGEPLSTQVGVGYVVMNRVKDKDHPDSICNVIYETGEFSGIKRSKSYKSKKNEEIWNRTKDLAKDIISEKIKNPIGQRVFFNHKRLGKKHKTTNYPIKLNNLVFY